jgi:tRNA threonylcarbamoyladenosine biosynthesis protein TsaB
MKILAIDSTAKAASIAVCQDERLLGLYTVDNGLTQSELLLPMAENMLKSLKLSFNDIELIAVATGPGSFTGVRIGAAMAKGIAFDRDIPCVSVSTLEELAENLAPLEGILIPAMDARRNQVYTATFRSDGKELCRLCEDRAVSINDLALELGEYKNEKIYISGDGYDVLKKGLDALGIKTAETPPLLICENAYSAARVALRKYKNGDFTSDTQLAPTYLRLPQAERERLEKEKQNNGKTV